VHHRPMQYKGATLLTALLLSLGTSGCSVGELVGGDRVHGDSNTVTVQAQSALDALPLAALHCSSFRKSAEYVRAQPGGRFSYRCV
jgi:hypothetical protein